MSLSFLHLPLSSLQTWNESSESHLLSTMSTLLSEHLNLTSSFSIIPPSKSLGLLLYELFWHSADSGFSKHALSAVCKFPNSEGFMNLLVDAAMLVWEDLNSVEQKTQLAGFLVQLRLAGVISAQKSLESFQGDLLEKMGEVANFKKSIADGLVRKRTQQRLMQSKYNLYREESEGFAKFLTEIYATSKSPLSATCVEKIRALMGCFRLDPNRCLDVLFDLFEDYSNPNFLILIDLFLPNHVLEVVCTRYSNTYANETFGGSAPTAGGESVKSNATFHKLVSMLLKQNKISLDAIYPVLSPSDESMFKVRASQFDEAKLALKASAVISLSDDGSAKGKPSAIVIDPDNQKFDLLTALIEIDWNTAEAMLQHLKPAAPVDYTPIRLSLLNLISKKLESVYSNCFSNSFLLFKSDKNPSVLMSNSAKELLSLLSSRNSQMESESLSLDNFCSLVDLINVCGSPLKYLGSKLSTDLILLTKICRIISAILGSSYFKLLSETEAESLRSSIVELLCVSILPSYSLSSCNYALSIEIWSILKFFPYEIRFSIYGQWKSSYDTSAELIYAKIEVIKQAKYFQKRLSKENTKPMRRALPRFYLHNPLLVSDCFFTQLLTYDNMISFFVEAFRNLSPLVFDSMLYSGISMLVSRNDFMQDNGTMISKWYQNLANLLGMFLCRYPETDFLPILFYILHQLKNNDIVPLYILKEIIGQATGIETTEDVSESQLLGQSGGPKLRSETAAFSQARNVRRRAAVVLLESLQNQKLIFPLLVLITHQREKLIFECDPDLHLRGIITSYDSLQDSLIQYSEYLSVSTSNKELAELFPTFHEMRHTFHLPPDAIFLMARSLLQVESMFSKADHSLAGNGTTLMKVVSTFVPEYVLKFLTPEFYLFFWQLSMYDLNVPSESYTNVIKKLHEQIAAISTAETSRTDDKRKGDSKEKLLLEINLLQKEQAQQESNFSSIKKRFENEKSNWFPLKPIKLDVSMHNFGSVEVPEDSSDFVKSCVAPNPVDMISAIQSPLQQRMIVFIHHCVLPRCLSSAIDSIYVAKFIEMLIDRDVPGFSFPDFLDCLSKSISSILVSVSTNEATRIGRFLLQLINIIQKWVVKSVFEKGAKLWAFSCGNKSAAPILSWYVSVRRFYNMIGQNFIQNLGSKSQVEQRNVLTVLHKISEVYPKLEIAGSVLEKRVIEVRDSAPRLSDLKLLATQVCGAYSNMKKLWVSEVEYFHKVSLPSLGQSIMNPAVVKVKVDETKKPEADSVKLLDSKDETRGKDARTTDSKDDSRGKESRSESRYDPRNNAESKTESKSDANRDSRSDTSSRVTRASKPEPEKKANPSASEIDDKRKQLKRPLEPEPVSRKSMDTDDSNNKKAKLNSDAKESKDSSKESREIKDSKETTRNEALEVEVVGKRRISRTVENDNRKSEESASVDNRNRSAPEQKRTIAKEDERLPAPPAKETRRVVGNDDSKRKDDARWETDRRVNDDSNKRNNARDDDRKPAPREMDRRSTVNKEDDRRSNLNQRDRLPPADNQRDRLPPADNQRDRLPPVDNQRDRQPDNYNSRRR